MKGWLFLAILLVLAPGPRASCDDAPREEDAIVFDEFFLSQFDEAATREFFESHERAYRTVTKSIKPINRPDWAEQKFTVFIEMLQYFVTYAREFSETRDASYASIGDFRASYLHKISPAHPGYSWQIDAFRVTNMDEQAKLETEGGGAGVRLDLATKNRGTFSFVMMPIYGERRYATYREAPRTSGSDYLMRANVGAAYSYKASPRIEPGVQVYFQPQIIDLGQFRVYAESFVRLKLVRPNGRLAEEFRVAEINLVPKVILWKATDEEGLFGDDIRHKFGNSYYQLNQHFYAFCNVEFRFRM